MADLATLFIKVDSKGVVTASKDLNKLTDDSKKTEKATESVTAGFNKMKIAVVALATSYAALKMAQYVRNATMLAARYETLGVVMRVVGNNAGYSGDQMEAYAKGLQKAGIAMIESRTTMARMVQAQIDLNKSSALARIAQDAAVIGNINSSESFERMINGIQRGMPLILRTIGINVDFQKSYKNLADTLDINVSELTDLQKIQARTNSVIQEGTKISGAYESSMDTAGKQVLSLTRHLDNLKVLLGEAFTPALAEIISQITGNIKALNGELSGPGSEAIKDWGNNFRLILITIEAEIMRVAMIIDQIGGTLSSIPILLFSPGAALGIENSVKQFEKWSDINIELEGRHNTTEKDLEDLAKRYNDLEFAMSPAGKAAQKLADDAKEATKLQAVAVKKLNEVVAGATKEQLKIQKDFATAYRKTTQTTQQFELSSLKIQVDAFRKAKVDETQLEEWMQNEIRNIKLRAQNEALALYEELAASDEYYAYKAIEVMDEILDAEERKWAIILKSDEDAHDLRLQREEEYRDKVLGVISDVTEARIESQSVATSGSSSVSSSPDSSSPSPGSDSSSSSSGNPGWIEGGTYDVVGGIVFINDRAGAIAYGNALDDQRAQAIQNAEELAQAEQQAHIDAMDAQEEAAQRAQDILGQRLELEIQLLEAAGNSEEALTLRRLMELEAMDESLRPLQQRLYYLEDEARATEEAADSMEKLIKAQDASIDMWEKSISTLVSQGRAIQDFINSLGSTGSTISAGAARRAYLSDLEGSRAGDVESYGRITKSAGSYISSIGQTAGSSVEMARAVADMKTELASLQPVVDLDSNIELLKAIRKATSDTATSTDRLDVLGIKAIFDLTQVINFVENSTGLNPAMRDLIIDQTADYMVFIDAQLVPSTPETLQRVLVEGVGIYEANVQATFESADEESQRLAIQAQGDYIASVRAAMDLAGSNPEAARLGLESANAVLTTVTAALNNDADSQQIADLISGDGVNTTIDGTMTWNPNDPMRSIWDAIMASSAATATNTGRLYVAASVETRPARFVENPLSPGGGYWTESGGMIYWSNGASQSYAQGGIATGPESGYEATLHGTELVVSPKTSFPATVKGGGGNGGSPEQTMLLKKIVTTIETGNFQIAKNTGKVASTLTRFDYDGIPAERTQ